MYKIGLTALLLLALNATNVKANNILIDSIGVENNNGKKLIVHQTAAKDTYYSIGRRYNIPPKEIMAFNDNKYLQIGVIIKVPTNIPFTNSTVSSTAETTSKNVSEHVVVAKDNLNMLAEKYGTTINELKSINNLSTINLRIGQVLKIPVKNGETPAPVNNTSVAKKETSATPPEQVNTTAETLIEHEVKPKEFLGKIAEKYGTTVEDIRKANNLSGNNLRIGQKLKIPATKNIDENKVVTTAETSTAQTTPATKDAVGTHTVKQGESIFNIAKQYSITAYQIRKTNNLEDNNLSTGQVLKIPSDIVTEIPPVKEKTTPAIVKETPNEESFIYNVGSGETIFSIAKKFSLTAYQIRTANKLSDNAVTVGQKLLIPKAPEPKSVAELAKQEQESNPDSTSFKDPKLRGAPSRYGLSQIDEKGAAVSISDPDLDASKMLVLHRTAPIGTIIKLTNPMTNRTALAKVVGKFTENESTKDVIIVMTKAVADSLGALDKRFFCNLTYGVHELE
ncbi:LysM peptidoglycan-binding domain-containing protein [Pedobacter aquatilis]|uniref:LysM peptidoglycan-binding domain-containing protein n=1 Tax=Pedobacter aquatilis TaxID=351343 RepID=UPI0025B3B3EC|nr:LysM peptidoglycan-binding domain-containing protein [Pedobacter aquatilis]MDN3585432.1 LysM peptidoglycan-binding domain-containing protein [Pedobacter aquatilis]